MRHAGRKGSRPTNRQKRKVHPPNAKKNLQLLKQGRGLLRCVKTRVMWDYFLLIVGRKDDEELGGVKIKRLRRTRRGRNV